MDHLTYTMHVQSFIYIVLSVIWLINIAAPSKRSWLVDIVLLAFIVYIVLSLRYLYQQSWAKTILKSVIAMVYTFSITIAVFVLVVLVGVALK
jgi:hypothetical protein